MPESVKKSLVIFIYFALALGVLLVFLQAGTFNFINCDDDIYVYNNPHVLQGFTFDSIIWAFTSQEAANWHPLTWLSLMLDCRMVGPAPGWMHLVNILLHLVNTLLLFAVFKKMTGALWPSAFVAAAFAIHPAHVESVAWIAERKDVLSTFFWMLTLLAYVGYVRRPSVPRYAATLAVFAVGLLAKPMLVTLPFVLLLLDYWPLDRFAPQTAKTAKSASNINKRSAFNRIIVEKIPFLALAAVSSAITFAVQRGGGAVVETQLLSLQTRVANAFLAYARYLGKMVWPADLAFFYPFDVNKFTFWPIALCVSLLVVITVLVVCLGRKHRYLPVGWFWFVGTLIPVIGLVQVGEQAMADRYTYIPYIGLFIMIAWGLPELLSKWPRRQIVLGPSMVVVLTALVICARNQVSYWNSSVTLFSHSVAVMPDNYVAHYNLANELRKRGKLSTAIEHYKKALEIKPRWANAATGLGCALAAQGDTAGAIRYLQKAVELKPDSVWAHTNLGLALVTADDLAQAIAEFRQASLLNPDSPDPMNNVALLIATSPKLKNRDPNEAIRFAARACKLTNYGNPAYLGTLAAAYASAGRYSDAVCTAKAAIKLADQINQPQVKKVIERQLTFYSQGKPYIGSPGDI